MILLKADGEFQCRNHFRSTAHRMIPPDRGVKRIVLLSGPVAGGKSTLARSLRDRFGAHVLSSRALLAAELGDTADREALISKGEELDRETQGRWVVNALARILSEQDVVQRDGSAVVIVDSVRTLHQVDAVRTAYTTRVLHVHLTAPRETLKSRYGERGQEGDSVDYDVVAANSTELGVETLRSAADVVVRVDQTTKEDVFVRVASHLGFYGQAVNRLVDVLVGGQYGSEGKGHVASFLAPEYDVLVRVGGPNAGHYVFERPQPALFHQLPSGTRRADHARIILGPGAVLNEELVLREIAEHQVDAARLAIDPRAMIIEVDDIESEAQLRDEIGSTGQGVGRATSRKVLRTSAEPKVRLARDIKAFEPYLRDTREVLEECYATEKHILLEGTQGTSLSLHHGKYPWVTSRDTTVSGCIAEVGIPPGRVRRAIMVCRTYPIRVESPEGRTSGPMAQEISWDEVAKRSGLDAPSLHTNERTSTTKRKRRVSEFDWTLLRTAATLNGPTDIALTFVDYLDQRNADARRFEQLTPETIYFVEEVERVSGAPVSLIATRFHWHSIIDRRRW